MLSKQKSTRTFPLVVEPEVLVGRIPTEGESIVSTIVPNHQYGENIESRYRFQDFKLKPKKSKFHTNSSPRVLSMRRQ